ncbi:MAG TPA: glycosyltransferase family 4 protein [Actinomycetota bacterium]|nr:glycosyltransferase family 4 protein [Actinomycetota bacterium]
MGTGRPVRLLHLTTVDLSLAALLLNQLERYGKEGYAVTAVSAPGPHVRELEEHGIRHIPIPSLTRSWTPLQDLRALLALRRLFRRERPDIVHTHNPKTGVLGRIAARLAGVPIVVNTVHGSYAPADLGTVKRSLVRLADRVSSRVSDFELFQSAEDHRDAVARGVVPARRAAWLGNGVDTARFGPDAVLMERVSALRSKWERAAGPETSRRFVVGMVGRLVREKGYVEFFRAADVVRRARPDALFVAVGMEDPAKTDRLSPEVLARVRAGESVVLAGEAAGADMPAVYRAFDLFALPSYREGVPRSAIEAMASARAVVATDVRGCREVVADGETGLLVPARDHGALARAILRLVEDDVLRTEMEAAGRRRVALRFDEERVIERTLAVYERLLRDRGRRG